jgi:hypothetical protein
MSLQKHPRLCRLRKADRHDLPAQLLDLRLSLLHLAEMLAARNSSEMAEEDEDEGFSVEIGKARGTAVEAVEGDIGDPIAAL